MSDFITKVHEVVRSIPRGTTMTYSAVALAAGHPKAARAVANLMAKNFDSTIPCHRVVRTDGRPGGYNRGGEAAKQRLLTTEGVVSLQNTSNRRRK